MRRLIAGLTMVTVVCMHLARAQYIDGRLRAIDVKSGEIPPTLSLAMYAAALSDSELAAVPMQEKKSPLLAGALSLAVPGAGQYYAESTWEAVGFAAAEAVMWIAYAVKTKEADQKTDEFQRYADQHYSVVAYAKWIEQYVSEINPGTNTAGMYDETRSSLPWEQINWGRLNAVEEELGAAVGKGFSHRLPARPEQQYFELIGKYPQYGGGWDDAAGFTPPNVVTDEVSQRFLLYRSMRGDANALYNYATGVSFALLANHVFSALHAAWSTARWNRAVQVSVHTHSFNDGTASPTVVTQLVFTVRLDP